MADSSRNYPDASAHQESHRQLAEEMRRATAACVRALSGDAALSVSYATPGKGDPVRAIHDPTHVKLVCSLEHPLHEFERAILRGLGDGAAL
ncbi:MAG: hypothetical protein EB075_14430, partial [Bacteroidetes bacterium]|nr:hypothetical protein [Bacteroidota bacterium]